MTESQQSLISTASPCARPIHRRLLDHLPALNVGVSWINSLLVTLGSFIVTPAILGGLGDQHYGIWLLITSFVGHMRILDLGMTSGCMKYTAGSFERGDRTQLQSIFNTSVAMFGAAAVLALLATVALTFTLPLAYPQLLAAQHAVIFVLGLSFVVDLLLRPYSASLRARSYFFVYDAVEIVTYLIFKLGLVLYLSHAGMSLWTLCVLSLCESVLRNLIVLGFTLRVCDWTARPDPRRLDRAMFGTLLKYSSVVFLIGLADLFRFQIDAAVIGYWMPDAPHQISIYGIGFRLVGIVAFSIGVVWAVLIPRFSGLSEKGDTQGILELLRRTSLTTGLLTVFGLVNIGVFGLPFLQLWLDKPWVTESYIITMIALPAYGIAMLHGPAGGMLSGMARLRGQSIITILEAACNVALSIALVGPLGIYGVCLGTAIPMLFFRGLAFPWVVKRETGIGFVEYYRMHARAGLVGAVYLPCVAGFAFLYYANFTTLLLACMASTGIYAVLLVALVPQAREIVFKFARRAPR